MYLWHQRIRDRLGYDEYKAKLEERAAQKEQGKKPRGPEPKEPSEQLKPGDQYNFTIRRAVLSKPAAARLSWIPQQAKSNSIPTGC